MTSDATGESDERVCFAPSVRFAEAVDARFLRERARLEARAPWGATLHVGSSAVPGGLTKGDLDLQLRVAASDFARTCAALDGLYARNDGGFHGPAGQSFEAGPDEPGAPSLGVHAIAAEGPDDVQWRATETLLRRPDLRGAYDALKKRFEGGSMERYREAKGAFFEEVASAPEYLATRGREPAPYQVTLETARLALRTPLATDAAATAAYYQRNAAHLAPWEPPRPAEFTTDAFWVRRYHAGTANLSLRTELTLLLRRREDPTGPLLGACRFSNVTLGPLRACNLGYSLDANAQGQGLMTEALGAALDYVFRAWGLHRVEASYRPENARSGRVLRALGFVVEGYARDYLFLDGAWRDHVRTAKTNPEPVLVTA